ncbi:uncharacterized protein [Watersipora subatra]|uniref:uncharacterized protein n=1 Tax=Watersipora subatra TaxID=2589382 RepID=UPI00355B88AB
MSMNNMKSTRTHEHCQYFDSTQKDNTHASITEEAIAKTIDEISSQTSLPEGDWRVPRWRSLNAILEGSNEIGQYKDDKAAYHFNAEKFANGNELLIKWRRQLLEIFNQSKTPHTLKIARHLIGQSLHLIQDFYSNSDWSEFKAEINFNLTMANREALKLFKWPCLDKNSNKMITGNIAHAHGYIASGFRSGQDAKKPNVTGIIGNELAGKCSHGGRFDTSSNLIARGGVNSESHNSGLSPKSHFHIFSSNWATKATQALFHSQSDYSLSSTLAPLDILRLLGVGVERHIGFLQTQFLWQLSNTDDWLSVWASYRGAWPWSVSHLYTASGDLEKEGSSVYERLRERPSNSSLPITEANILHAAETLPDDSDFVIVTNGTLDGTLRAELIRKVFVARGIRIWWFVTNPKSAEQDTLKMIAQICLTTRGMMFYIKGSRDLVDIIHTMKADMYITHYVTTNTMHIFLPKDSSTFVVTNCVRAQINWLNVKTIFGQIAISGLVSTDFTAIYKVTPLENKDLIGVATLGDENLISCTVSTWTSRPLARVQPVAKGPRDQWYPKNQVCSGCLLAIKSAAKNVQAKINQRDLNVSGCKFENSNDETERISFTKELTNFETQPRAVTVTMKYSKAALEMNEYIDSQHVDIQADSILLSNATSADVEIRNLLSVDVEVEMAVTQTGIIAITPKSCSLTVNAVCSVKLIFHSNPISQDNRPISLVAISKSEASDEELYDTRTLYIIPVDQHAKQDNQQTTSTPSFTTHPTSYDKGVSISKNLTYPNTSRSGEIAVSPFDTTRYLLWAIFGTFAPLIMLVIIIAALIYVCHTLYLRRRYQPPHKQIPIDKV